MDINKRRYSEPGWTNNNHVKIGSLDYQEVLQEGLLLKWSYL